MYSFTKSSQSLRNPLTSESPINIFWRLEQIGSAEINLVADIVYYNDASRLFGVQGITPTSGFTTGVQTNTQLQITPLFARHLKTKTNLLRLIYSRRVVDEILVDQFIFKLFYPYPLRTYALLNARRKFCESAFLTSEEIGRPASLLFSLGTCRRLGTARWLATFLIMLRNSDICARPNRNARNSHFARNSMRRIRVCQN